MCTRFEGFSFTLFLKHTLKNLLWNTFVLAGKRYTTVNIPSFVDFLKFYNYLSRTIIKCVPLVIYDIAIPPQLPPLLRPSHARTCQNENLLENQGIFNLDITLKLKILCF